MEHTMDDLDTLTVEQLRTSLRAEVGRAAWIAAANRETCLSVLRGGPVPTMTLAAVHDAGKLAAPAPAPSGDVLTPGQLATWALPRSIAATLDAVPPGGAVTVPEYWLVDMTTGQRQRVASEPYRARLGFAVGSVPGTWVRLPTTTAPAPPAPAEPQPPADVAGQIAALVTARLAPVVGPEAAAEAGQTAARAALAAVSPVVMGALFGAR